MIRINVRPVKRPFTRRRQWIYEFVAANGEKLDPRDTYNNQAELIDMVTQLVAGTEPVELVVFDTDGPAIRRQLR